MASSSSSSTCNWRLAIQHNRPSPSYPLSPFTTSLKLFPSKTIPPSFTSSRPSSTQPWLYGCFKRRQGVSSSVDDNNNGLEIIGSNDEVSIKIPTQAQTAVQGSGGVSVSEYPVSEYKPAPDVDYLQELLAIQQQGPRSIGFFGTRNMGFMHQELIEILSYAMVITKNHIFTSGASGTNAAVIRGAMRAERPDLLTVILPQSLKKQPPESQELLSKVKNVIEKPYNDHLPLLEASSDTSYSIAMPIGIDSIGTSPNFIAIFSKTALILGQTEMESRTFIPGQDLELLLKPMLCSAPTISSDLGHGDSSGSI